LNALTATYSPEDNKLRLYPVTRLDKKTYERVRGEGFIWAPKQELFVAPAWSPSREDLLIELCREIGDEDTSLVDRAAERAERFQDYSEKRADEAQTARETVSKIADNIPFGQPILVGHHSERHARKDAERIENGMRKAVQLWDTAKYWKQRAAGAIRHAKYKELPGVRHRRIKGLESEKRKQERRIAESERYLKLWQHGNMTPEFALKIAATDRIYFRDGDDPYGTSAYTLLTQNKVMPEECARRSIGIHTCSIEFANRWLAHLNNRLEYERAMLEESGGLAADRFNIEIGGQVLARGEWVTVLRVNRVNGVISSLRTTARYVPIVSIEKVKDYRAPSAEDAAKVKAATKLAPLCNYPGPDFRHMTKAEWDRKHKDYKTTRDVGATEKTARHRVRYTLFGLSNGYQPVYLTDAKLVEPPAPVAVEPIDLPPNQPVIRERRASAQESSEFDAIREQLKRGVQVVSAPQLFPTPPDLADRMVRIADIETGQRILEPSAGTGNIVWAIARATSIVENPLTAVEANHKLAAGLSNAFPDAHVKCDDFLQCNGDLGQFDRILMNPPFEDGSDLKHILHAMTMLKPGGKLVAICANGPRQNEKLQPLADTWEVLPPNTFKEQGTGVRTVLMTIERPHEHLPYGIRRAVEGEPVESNHA
jgi:phospholipid N-methyltransferase